VPLASLTDPDLVLPTIAATLGIREEGGQPLGERLRDFLAAKLLLLVLDNMEHLVAAAPAVGGLLGISPGLKVLATSRMPLRLRAEREYAVPPLGLPRRKPPPPPEQLSQFESVRLFIDRAQAVKADFAIDNETAPAVAEICWRLDGLPLAIELAAARVRMLPPHAMLSRLEQRLPLLTGGARDAPERQRTLRNTIVWSYDLLEPEDQVLFRRLAAFAGGCTLEAAEAVGNHDGSLDAFGGVERLCEHSLLRQEEDPGGEPRFTMLETVREFALEQLKASGEEQAVRDAHAGAMLALADLAAPHLEGGEQGLWKTRLEADVANLRAAVGWLRMQGRVSEVLHLGAAIKWFWYIRHAVEAGQWLEAALADAGNVSWDVKADALHAAGHLARFRADIPRATELHREELTLRQAAGDEVGLGRLLLAMGIEATERGDSSAATPYLKDALDRLRGANDAWAVSISLAYLGDLARLSGDLEGAARRYEEAAQTQRGIGDTYHVVLTLINLARVRTQQGKFEQAQELGLAALTAAEDAGLERSRVMSFGALADIAIAATNLDAAEEYLLKALEIDQAIGGETDIGETLVALGALHHRRGNDQAAFAYLRQGLELVRSMGYSRSVTFCLEVIAVIAADRGMVEPAARLLGAAAAADPGVAVYRFPSEQASYERVMDRSRSMLGEAAFATAFEAGQDLPVSGALTEVLDLTNRWAHEVVTACVDKRMD
jgi:predicted ATPase/Tfp pilus assembly protein PilF